MTVRCVLVPLVLAGALCAGDKAPADALAELEKIAATYKIDIVTADVGLPVKTFHGLIDGKSSGTRELAAYARLFAAEWALYPPDFIKRSQLTRVVLCTELTFAGQRRNAVPDFEHNVLYLDVARGTYSRPYLRKVIHHEFFHIVDLRDDSNLYQDERWEGLNRADFKYGSGGKNAQGLAQTSVLTDKYPGFLNHYSTTGVEEDKAEVFANLIVDPGYVEDRARKDRVLEAKIKRMRKLLADFCPDLNDDFWEKVRTRKRSDK